MKQEPFKVLVTCPPMLGMMTELRAELLKTYHWELICPPVVQTLSEGELLDLVPTVDGWIIGDDGVSKKILAAGLKGRFKAAVKWGIGVDAIDLTAMKELKIPFSNTPGMFGQEVADLALSYITALARETFWLDREVRAGRWSKPRGISLADKKVCIVGYGDIGRNLARRCLAAEMQVTVVDPTVSRAENGVNVEAWPQALEGATFLALTCALTTSSRGMVNAAALQRAPRGLRVVNVARGPIIVEKDLIAELQSGQVHSAALDVFEEEPLPTQSPLRKMEKCIFGSHNASNTQDAVRRTSLKACALLQEFLAGKA